MQLNRLWITLLMTLLAGQAMGAEAELEKKLTALFQQKPTSIEMSPIAGLYEVNVDGRIMFVSPDGNYLIDGQMFDVNTRENLTQNKLNGVRKASLEVLGEQNMIIYAPKRKSDYTITVFTDIDCGYCRRLHEGMAKMNSMGIKVRYLAYPRAGKDSASYNKFVDVWCSDDRHEALDRAKRGVIDTKPANFMKTCKNPIDKHMEMAQKFGVTGTPAIITEDGSLVPGYLPPEQLLAMLKGESR